MGAGCRRRCRRRPWLVGRPGHGSRALGTGRGGGGGHGRAAGSTSAALRRPARPPPAGSAGQHRPPGRRSERGVGDRQQGSPCRCQRATRSRLGGGPRHRPRPGGPASGLRRAGPRRAGERHRRRAWTRPPAAGPQGQWGSDGPCRPAWPANTTATARTTAAAFECRCPRGARRQAFSPGPGGQTNAWVGLRHGPTPTP